MPTIADITGAGRLGFDAVFAVAGQPVPRNGWGEAESMFDGFPVAQRTVSPGRMQAV
jgi:hypothetical protein